jgi:hypothetical protein
MKRLYTPATYLLTLICALLVACAQLGLPTPTTINEKIAAAQASVTQVRQTATQLLTAGKITVADAENVLKTTDAASEGIAVARTLSLQDPNAAQARLTMVVTALTAIQAYLATKS